MEVSSTTTTSWGSRLSRLWRNRVRLPRVEPEQPVQGRAAEREQPLRDVRRRRPMAGRLVAHRLLEAGRRLAGRRGQGDEGRSRARGRRPARRAAPAPAPPSSSCRCPGPPATTDTRRRTAAAAARRCRSGPSLVPSNSARQARGEQRRVDALGRRRRPAPAGRRHLALVRPEPVEVERRPGQVQRAVVADQRALAPAASTHVAGLGPRQRVEVHRRVGVAARGAPDRGQVDADVAEPRGPGGEGRARRTPLVVRAAEPRRAAGRRGRRTARGSRPG